MELASRRPKYLHSGSPAKCPRHGLGSLPPFTICGMLSYAVIDQAQNETEQCGNVLFRRKYTKRSRPRSLFQTKGAGRIRLGLEVCEGTAATIIPSRQVQQGRQTPACLQAEKCSRSELVGADNGKTGRGGGVCASVAELSRQPHQSSVEWHTCIQKCNEIGRRS